MGGHLETDLETILVGNVGSEDCYYTIKKNPPAGISWMCFDERKR